MNLLAFDTSTEALSVAVRRADAPPRVHEGAGGARASITLIPVIQELLAGAGLQLRELDAIVFGRGPGSFTGLRTACSVAQGLAFGAGTPVLPVDTLLAVAEEARFAAGFERVVAVLDARMDEVYWGAYVHEQGRWRREGEIGLGRPESLAVPDGWAIAGNAFAPYPARLPADAPRVPALPTAAALLRLSPAMLAAGLSVPAAGALPLYIRDKVAQTTAERAAAHAARSA
ncbi:MAG: tRNA (adenosine(37)-N6)-threonylcarbamoyltransferase complex dimerization subunit type 1 TsaB [Comamonadaceae bacterium]|nr:MAG: tRNA (adenosine(37)-N6)-threonylcarbamoyltransferase complex dimerization subunit type 1 TsaB [Comamonadaceae bacterium]